MRTYGECSYLDAFSIWVVRCEPHVSLKLKRIFPSISPGSQGSHQLTDTPDNAADLTWVLTRYPMVMRLEDRARLRARTSEYRARVDLVAEMMAGRATPPDVKLALPLRDYQKTAVAMTLAMRSLLLADQMGLGKTASIIGVIANPECLPALVVTMTSLTLQWQREIARFAPDLRTHILKHSEPYKIKGGFPDVVLSSYTKLHGWAETLAGVVKTAAFDEVQELRHMDTHKYNAASHVAGKAVYVIGATGTPIYNGGAEFFSVANIIRPGSLGSRVEFVREWCTDTAKENRENITNPRAFGTYVRESGLMLRRTRADVVRELPDLTRVTHHVDANLGALDEVSASCRELALFILGRGKKPSKMKGDSRGDHMLASEELSNQLRMATGMAKAPYVAELVKLIAHQERKVTLFGWHRSVYAIWLEALKEFAPVMYTGSESPKQKDEARSRFIDGDSRVLIMSLRSGAGLDGLQQACHACVFGELDWSYGVHDQCEARIHRDGQAEPVFAYYALSDVGSDPIVADTLGIKRNQLEGIRDPSASLVGKLQNDPNRIKRLAEAYLEQRRETHEHGFPRE